MDTASRRRTAPEPLKGRTYQPGATTAPAVRFDEL
jgi:hypothetical protein